MTPSETPSDHPKRAYHSPARQRQAEETRQRMLDAARTLFVQLGYATTTLDAIAKAADVSPKTVTAVFGSKRGILAALFSPIMFGARYQLTLEQLRAVQEPERRIALITQLTRQVYETLTAEFELLRGASTVAADLAEVAEQIETRRRQYQARFITFVAEQGKLRLDLDRKETLDELWSLTGYDLYRMLIGACSWTPDRYESWLTALLIQRLLEQAS